MKRLAIIALLIFVGFAGWRAGGVLSTDAMSMAVGVVFGVLASIPAALLILAASRRSAQTEPQPSSRPAQQTGFPSPYHQGGAGQMPIVIVAPPNYPGYGQPAGNPYAQLPGPQSNGWAVPSQPARPQRAFTIVGEQSDSVDDF